MKKSRKITGNPIKSFMDSASSIEISTITVENFDKKLSRSLNFQQRNFDNKEARDAIIKFKPELSNIINALSENEFHEFKTLGFTCNFLLENNLSQNFHKETGDWIDSKISLINEKYNEKKLSSNNQNKTKHDVQKAILNQISEKLGDIDEHFDDYVTFIWKGTPKPDFDILEYIKKCEFSSLHVRKIYNHYLEHLQDLRSALECTIINKYNKDGIIGEHSKESDLKEGYSYLGDRKLKKLINFYEIELKKLDDFVKLNSNRRKTKAKNPSIKKIVSKVKYLKEDKSLGVVSLNPEKIVGNSVVILYNVAKKRVTILKSNDISGLYVKGTTIYNINEKSSFSKIISKPSDIVNFVKTSKNAASEYFNKLKNRQSPATGRINEETIILNVFK